MMLTDREIALDQALMALLGEAIASGWDTKILIDDAVAGLLAGATYQWVGFPHVENAVQVLLSTHAKAVIWSQEQRGDKKDAP